MPEEHKEKDLNKEGESSAEGDHSGNEGGDDLSKKDEEITTLKADLEKSNVDRDNYKEGLLRAKGKLDLEEKGSKGEGEGGGEGEEKVEVDIEKIKSEATTSVFSEIGKSNERRAKESFLRKHPELLDDIKYTDFLSDFPTGRKSITVEDYSDALQDTMLLYKRRTGQLDEYLKKEREQGKREGEGEANIRNAGDAGGVGDQGGDTKDKGFSSEKGEEIARGMKVDPEKSKGLDPSKDNTIEIR